MTLMTLVRDEDENALLGVIADAGATTYVWPRDTEPWFDGAERIAFLTEALGSPETDEAWLDLATTNLGLDVHLDEPYEFDDVADATLFAGNQLNPSADDEVIPDPPQILLDASDAFDQVSGDYPDLIADDENESVNQEALAHLVELILGPVDPEGLNGWVERTVEGHPLEGDDDALLRLPGTPVVDDAVESEETPEEVADEGPAAGR